ncbi:MAG TPA: ABC transporter permease subunit [Pseudolysinimonas sp.]|jgi:NitT/TauT family transport system permease protein
MATPHITDAAPELGSATSSVATTAVGQVPATPSEQQAVRAIARRKAKRTLVVRAIQLGIVVILILGWQFLPGVPGIQGPFPWLNTFFISSPTMVAQQLGYLTTGAQGATQIWGPFAQTILTALAGTLSAMIVGTVAGIAVSNWRMLADITRPFLVVVNAVPKVAVIPIIILIVHEAVFAAIVTSFISVFFLAFYNATEGASSVPREMIQNAELLGATKVRVMLRVRSPYAIGWTLAALPNAIAFGLTATVTAEIILGGSGLGYQMLLALNNSNSSLLLAIVLIVAIVGVALVLGATALRRVILPWWESSQAN